MKNLSEPKAKTELGVSGTNIYSGDIRADEFLPELRGRRAVKKFREMRDNDSTIGAVMYAMEQVLRDVPFKVDPSDDSQEARDKADFVKQVLDDMEHSLDDHISEAISFLSFGFATFEVVYKRRVGPNTNNPKKWSKYDDGYIGVRKLSPRAQWTINRFDVEKQSGQLNGVYQDKSFGSGNYIPSTKLVHYKTPTLNNDPSGRSVLRNAYKSYTYLSRIQEMEAVGIERELHGIPVGRLPAEYLAINATDEQKAVRQEFERVLRDVKFNEQGFILIPSDLYTDQDGNPTDYRLVEVDLMSSSGTRSVPIDPVVKRYQHDIARSIMAEFLMLGGGSTGSYALSKSKTDLFLRSLEAYINTIYDVINKQLVESLWKLNGFDFKLLPKIVPGDVAPHDLKELGSFLRNLNGASIDLSNQTHLVNELLAQAELSEVDPELYQENIESKRQADLARSDYYDGPDDNVVGSKGKTSEEEAEDRPKDQE